MEKLRVHSGHKLFGQLKICSSKNAILPILAGSIISSGEVKICSIPNFVDIHKMVDLMKSFGVEVQSDEDSLIIDTKKADKFLVSHEMGKDIREKCYWLI